MKLTQRNSMVPFLRLREGEYFIVRILDRQIIDIKSDSRDCIKADVYYAGTPVSAPTPIEMMEALASPPNLALVGANKSFDDLYEYNDEKTELISHPIGKFYLLHYGGRKEIAGGKKFNMWSIQELELSEAELKKVHISDQKLGEVVEAAPKTEADATE